MTGDQTSHITVTYRIGSKEITCTYAISETMLRDAQIWQQEKKPAGEDVERWLERKGCQLDSSDGPAFAERHDDGFSAEAYYNKGKLHRDVGPALVYHYATGSAMEMYYRNGVARLKAEYDTEKNQQMTKVPLSLVTSGQEAVDALVNEAIADQSAARPGQRECIPLPLCL